MPPKSNDEPYEDLNHQCEVVDRPIPPARIVQSTRWKMASVQAGTLHQGTSRFVIESRWLRNFLDYIGQDENNNSNLDTINSLNPVYPPGPINNRRLIQSETINYNDTSEDRFTNQVSSSNSEEQVLRKDLVEKQDFELLTSEQWKLLTEWYGGGPTIERTVIREGRQLCVELHPLQLWVRRESDPSREFPLLVSKADLMAPRGLRNKAFKKLKAHIGMNSFIPSNTEIKLLINGIERDESSESDLEDFSCVIVKDRFVQNRPDAPNDKDDNNEESPSRSYLIPPMSSVDDVDMILDKGNRISSNDSNFTENRRRNDCSVAPGCGAVGLQNLGNTCFMNSALQCLSNTEALTRYFLDGSWQSDLNVDNPLGMKGMLAENYSNLLRSLWTSSPSYSVTPRDLKRVIGHFAPQFSGYSQHDAQELLAFLLDGLHEDLNRIRSKPFVEIPSGDGTDDSAIAQLAWQRHKMRNDSFVVDLFTGQYRSELVCPVTGKKSVTFDPYNCVTLQLPQLQEGRISCTIHRCPPGTTATKCTLQISRAATYFDVRKRLSSVAGIDLDRIVLADVYGCRFYTFYRDSASVWSNPLATKCFAEVHAYETPVPAPSPFDSYESRLALGHRQGAFTSVSHTRCQLDLEEPFESARAGCALFKVLHRRSTPSFYYQQRDWDVFGTPMIIAVPRDGTGRIRYEALEQQICMAVANSCRGRSPALSSSTTSSGKCSSSSTLLDEGHDYCRRNDAMVDSDGDGSAIRTTKLCRGTDFYGGRVGKIAESDCTGEEDWEEWQGTFVMRKIDGNHYYQSGLLLVDCGKPLFIEPLSTIGVDWTQEGLRRLSAARAGIAEEASSDNEDAEEGSSDEEVSLERLMTLFAVPEELSEEDAWYSPFAGRHVRATKTMGLWSVPTHLVIHLKRFAASGAGAFVSAREKLDTLVRFPLRGLDMSPFVRGPGLAGSAASQPPAGAAAATRSAAHTAGGELLYDLYAVVNHYGGAGFGHYTACCLSPGDGKWYLFDDSSVTNVADPAREIVTPAAYVLFYRLRPVGGSRL